MNFKDLPTGRENIINNENRYEKQQISNSRINKIFMKHPIYSEPVITIDYSMINKKNNTQNVVYNKTLTVGDLVEYPWSANTKVRQVFKKVDVILEQRESKGVFDNYERPRAFKVALSKQLYFVDSDGVTQPLY